LNETIILYDLTNTYLTGRPFKSHNAYRGRSKEKRYDCPLLALALVLVLPKFRQGGEGTSYDEPIPELPPSPKREVLRDTTRLWNAWVVFGRNTLVYPNSTG
jgi:hypothetical protein